MTNKYLKIFSLIVIAILLLAFAFVTGAKYSQRHHEEAWSNYAAIGIATLAPAVNYLNENKLSQAKELVNIELDRNLSLLAKYQDSVKDKDEIARHRLFLHYLWTTWKQHPPFQDEEYKKIYRWKEDREFNDAFLKRSAEAYENALKQ